MIFHGQYICQCLQPNYECAQAGVQEIQMPIAPEKSEDLATMVEFLGLTLDTNYMVIHIPPDKLQDIAQIISKMVKNRKTMSWELQSLAGKLNFIAKVVPAGKCLIK